MDRKPLPGGEKVVLSAEEITEMYSERLKDPEVNVIAVSIREPMVYVVGEAAVNTRLPLKEAQTAAQAITLAGGFRVTARVMACCCSKRTLLVAPWLFIFPGLLRRLLPRHAHLLGSRHRLKMREDFTPND